MTKIILMPKCKDEWIPRSFDIRLIVKLGFGKICRFARLLCKRNGLLYTFQLFSYQNHLFSNNDWFWILFRRSIGFYIFENSKILRRRYQIIEPNFNCFKLWDVLIIDICLVYQQGRTIVKKILWLNVSSSSLNNCF